MNESPRTCTRCNGTGILPAHENVANGQCFTCEGTGSKLRTKAAPKVVTFGRWTITLSDNRTHYAVLVQHPEVDSVRTDHPTLDEARLTANAAFRTIKNTEAPR
jgi:hypothetical protein